MMSQNRLHPVTGIFLLIMSLAATAPALADGSRTKIVNRELSQSISTGYLKQQKYEAAEQHLNQHLAEDPEDDKSWNTLGLIALEQKNWSKAEEAFRKAASLATGDDKAVYLYNAADASNRAGPNENSRRFLNEAEQSATPLLGIGDQIERTRGIFRAGEPLPSLVLEKGQDKKSYRITAWASLKAGYDSNVTLLPNNANRNPNPSSPLISPTGFIEYGRPLWDGSFAARSLTTYTDYTSESANIYSNIYESLAVEWSPKTASGGKLSTTFGDRFNFSFANTDGFVLFSWADFLYSNATYRIDQESSIFADLPVGYQAFPGVALAAPADDRSGILFTPSVIYRRKVQEFTLSGGASFQSVWAKGNNFKSNSYGVLGGLARTLPGNIDGRLGAGYLWTLYPNSSVDRIDHNFNVSLSLSRVMPFDKRMSANLSYILIGNTSVIDTASYRQNVLTLQVSYAIQ